MFPRFRATASDELEAGNRDPLAAARLKLRKAFTPAQPINDRGLFAGRRRLVSTMIRSIEDARVHTIVYGQRGIGKTSLLHVIADAAREARYLVSYVSCGATASFDETFRAIASEIPLMYHTAYGPKAPEAERGGVFADVLREGAVTPLLAADVCAKVAGTRVLVIVDEFDRSASPEFRRDMAEFLKNLSDRSVRVQLLIAGVAENLDDLLEAGVLLQRNVVALEVPRMGGEEVRDLIAIGQDVSGLTFDDKAAELLIAAASGLPYIASLLAQHAGLCALSEERLTISREDVISAIEESLAEMKGRVPRLSLAQLTGVLRHGGDNLLAALASLARSEDGRFSVDDINSASGGALEAARNHALIERLAREGILIAHEGEGVGRYRLVDLSIAPYLWLMAVRGVSEGSVAPGAPSRIAGERS